MIIHAAELWISYFKEQEMYRKKLTQGIPGGEKIWKYQNFFDVNKCLLNDQINDEIILISLPALILLDDRCVWTDSGKQ